MRTNFSKAYHDSLNITRKIHKVGKVYSGKFVKFYRYIIRELIDENECKTLLDYGCGRCSNYGPDARCPDGDLEMFWGVEVTKYDPGVPKYWDRPDGKFDIVIACQVLNIIPEADRIEVMKDMVAYANKVVWIGERDREPKEYKKPKRGYGRGWGEKEMREALEPLCNKKGIKGYVFFKSFPGNV